jgi:hypothetical protein
VPVFGVGEQGGPLYHVMQLIPGLGMDVVLDELRRLRLPRCKLAPTQADAAGRATDGTRDVSAASVVGRVSLHVSSPGPAGPQRLS